MHAAPQEAPPPHGRAELKEEQDKSGKKSVLASQDSESGQRVRTEKTVVAEAKEAILDLPAWFLQEMRPVRPLSERMSVQHARSHGSCCC